MPRPHKRSGNSSNGKGIGTVSAVTTFDRMPLRQIPNGMVKMASGRVFESFGYGDPFFPNSPGLWSSVSEDFVLDGVNGPGAIPGEAPYVNFVDDLYVQLINRAISLGFNTSNMTLSEEVVFGDYLSSYCSVYSTLRGLQALMNMNGYNRACTLIAANLWEFRLQIEAIIARLEGLTMVPGLLDAVDKMSNVYVPDNSGTAPYFHFVDPGSQSSGAWVPTDFGSVPAIQNMLNNLDNRVTTELNEVPADTIRIQRLLSWLYGPGKPLGAKAIDTTESMYYMHLSRAFCFVNTTSGNGETAPFFDPTVIQDNIIYVYGDTDKVDPLWFTLIRPTLYYTNSGVGVATIGSRGAFTTPITTGNGTMVEYYSSQSAAFSQFTGAATAAPVLSLNDAADEFPFARPAQLQLTTAQQLLDARVLPGWERFYIPYATIADESLKFLQKWFFTGITASGKH